MSVGALLGRLGTRLENAREWMRERLWLWPAVTAVVAVAAAEGLVRVDRLLDESNGRPLWVFSGNAAAARSVLSTIAAATMTVLGVTLTITLAVLALTAQGYSPRVLRRFMRDRVVTSVIAGFTGAFVFALVALRLVRADAVPGITVNVAAALALMTVFLLVGFFHHLATEIRVERLIEAVWAETRQAIEAHLPPEREAARAFARPDGVPLTVPAPRSGRLRAVDVGALAHVAGVHGVTVTVRARPGDYVNEGAPVAEVVGEGGCDDRCARAVAAAIDVGGERRLGQDLRFGLRQLVDIALRALSPGVNDATTAWEAIMRLADLMRRIAPRELGDRVLTAGDGVVVVAGPEWDELTALAFGQLIDQAEAQADAATARTLLDALGRVLQVTDDPRRVEALRAHARRMRDGVRRAVADEAARASVEEVAAGLA